MSTLPYQNPDVPFADRAKDLVARMTLEERIAQIIHEAPGIDRLGVQPHNYWNEGLHGVARGGLATVFPTGIAMAATFDTELHFRVATAISDEARAKHHANAAKGDFGMYKGLAYWTPNINIFRDPRWGRGQETYGECPYLTSRLGVALVKAFQGDHPKYLKLTAAPKHYAVHSGPEAVRHSFDAVVSMQDLRETYLPAFRATVIEGKAASIMGAYNRTNGQPCCAHPLLLETILRGEWGFEGYVVSDCGAIEDFDLHHKVTGCAEESAAMALRRGSDLNCGTVYGTLPKALRLGLVTEAEITRAAERVMESRLRLGCFDPPDVVPYAKIPYEVIECDAHVQLAREAAQKSIVLLKNEGNLLPLPVNLKRIAVIGPNANDWLALVGNYNGIPSHWVTPLEGIRARMRAAGAGTQVSFCPGSEWIGVDSVAWGRADKYFAEARIAAERADAVVLCLGITSQIEGEEGDASLSTVKGDRIDVGLPAVQEALLKAVLAVGKPTVLVLISGSAISVPYAAEQCPAILQQFYPGQQGGAALADVLFGDVSPAGRLPVTVVRATEDLPPFESYAMTGRTYRFLTKPPLYPFGFGLSYSRFRYSDVKVLPGTKVGPGDPVRLSGVVTNMGERASDEVAQVYATWVDSAGQRAPNHQLVAMRRVHLHPGHSRALEFEIDPRWLALVDEDGQHVARSGRIRLSLGGSQPDALSARLGAAEPACVLLEVSGAKLALPG